MAKNMYIVKTSLYVLNMFITFSPIIEAACYDISMFFSREVVNIVFLILVIKFSAFILFSKFILIVSQALVLQYLQNKYLL